MRTWKVAHVCTTNCSIHKCGYCQLAYGRHHGPSQILCRWEETPQRVNRREACCVGMVALSKMILCSDTCKSQLQCQQDRAINCTVPRSPVAAADARATTSAAGPPAASPLLPDWKWMAGVAGGIAPTGTWPCRWHHQDPSRRATCGCYCHCCHCY